MDVKNQLNELAAPFESAALEKNKDGFTYIKYPYVIERLNNVFGHLWSIDYKPFQSRNENEYSVEVIVTVQFSDGVIRTCKAVGSNRNFKSGTEDVHKACVSSAVKKAVMQIGVGNYIAMNDKDISIPDSANFVTEYSQQNQPVADIATVANDEMTMPFGKHKGIKIKDLSLSYLNWLANSSNLRENLRAAVDQALLEQTKASAIADVLADDVPWI